MATQPRPALTNQGAALLEWFDSLPPLAYTRERQMKWEDLVDGHKIWELLNNLEPEHFYGDLPQAPSPSRKWLDSWENLKHIYKILAQFVKERRGSLPSGYSTLHLKEIAMQADAEELSKASGGDQTSSLELDTDTTIQLLKMVLFVATRAADNEAYIGVMVQMPEDRQKYIMRAIVEVGNQPQTEPMVKQFLPSIPTNEAQFQESTPSEPDGSDPPQVALSPPTAAVSLDKDLLHEQQLAGLAVETDRLIKDKKDLQKDVYDLNGRIERLHQHNSTLQEELKDAQDRLEELSFTEEGQAIITRLNKRLRDQEDLIAQQETQLRDKHTETETLHQEVARLHLSESEIQTLKDEFSIAKSDRDQLTRNLEGKSNTIDKLKQKVQTLQHVEKDNDSLRLDIGKVRLIAEDGNSAKEKVLQLEQQLAEYRNVIPSIEQELHESREIRKRKDLEMQQNRMELDQVREQYNQAQSTITELIEQVRHSAQKSSAGTNLDFELRAKAEHELQVAQTALMMAKLTSESTTLDLEEKNRKLQVDNDEMATKQTNIEKMLENMMRQNEDLGKRFGDTYKEKLNLENRIREIQRSGTIQGLHISSKRDEPTANKTKSASHQTIQDTKESADTTLSADRQVKAQLDEQKAMMQTLLGTDPSDSTASNEAIKEILNLASKAVADGPSESGDKSTTTEQHINELAASIEESRRKLMLRSEVQFNLRSNQFDDVSLRSAPSTTISPPSRSRKFSFWPSNKRK